MKTIRTARLVALAVIFISATGPGLYAQLTQYTYTGNHFTSVLATGQSPILYTTSDSIFGYIITQNPLPPNLNTTFISPNEIFSFSFSDGVFIWHPSNSIGSPVFW